MFHRETEATGKIEHQLRDAQAGGDYVKVRRRGRGVDTVDGFCAAVGEEWVVIAAVSNDIRLDGHSFLRLADVRAIENRGSQDFVPRALQQDGDWPPPPAPNVRLGSVRDLLTDTGHVADLVTIYTERLDPAVCFIGRPIKVGRTKLHLDEVDPQAAWSGVRKYDLDAITRVEIGGRYEAMLGAVAEPKPD